MGGNFSFWWPGPVVAGLMHLCISQELLDVLSPPLVEEVICRFLFVLFWWGLSYLVGLVVRKGYCEIK